VVSVLPTGGGKMVFARLMSAAHHEIVG